MELIEDRLVESMWLGSRVTRLKIVSVGIKHMGVATLYLLNFCDILGVYI